MKGDVQMKTILKLLNTFIFVMLLTGYADAAPSEWNIDRVHSNIYFDITHIFSTVRGKFNDFSGKPPFVIRLK